MAQRSAGLTLGVVGHRAETVRHHVEEMATGGLMSRSTSTAAAGDTRGGPPCRPPAVRPWQGAQ